jgi:rod shape-determining protein MreC
MALYSRPRNTRLLVVSLVMASLITITIDYRGGESGPFEVAGRGALSVVGALQGAVSRVVRPIGDFFTGLAHVGSLKSDNERLKNEVQRLKEQSQESTSLERQNKELFAILGLTQNLGLRGVAATVIGEGIGNFEWTRTIDRGEADGIRVDMPVVSGEGLVGHVIAVSGHSSTIQLIIDPDSAVAGRLASSGETGLVVGQRDQDLTMDLVSPEAKITAGEQVVTSGYQTGLYPPEILIGTVSHSLTKPGTLTKVLALRPAVDFSALEFVFIVTGPSEP